MRIMQKELPRKGGKSWHGGDAQGRAGEAWPGAARRGMARPGSGKAGEARRGKAWRGESWTGEAWLGEARPGAASVARQGLARRGRALARQARRGAAGPDKAGQRKERLVARGRIGSDEREQIHKRASEGMGVREIAEALGRTEDTIRKALGGAAKKSAAPAKRSRSGSARTPRPRKAPAAAPQHVNGETLGDIAKQMMKAGEFERTFTIPVTIRIG